MRPILVGGLFATALLATACHKMTTVSIEQVAATQPSRVWITTGDSTVIVAGPQVFGDTLVGYVNGTFEEINTSQVTQAVVRQRDKGKTIALIAAGTVAGTLMAYLISGAGDAPMPPSGVDCDDDPEDPRCMGLGVP
jgi:hypothetical protein